MKVTVKIDHQVYEVEVGDLTTRPIVATVDGQPFEVWPEEAAPSPTPAPARKQTGRIPSTPSVVPHPAVRNPPTAAGSRPAPAAPPPANNGAAKTVPAPIPGVVVEITAKAGDAVETGQPLCVLEAMKMKNVIRAPRTGTIAAVRVSTGQHVKHRDPLFEYAD